MVSSTIWNASINSIKTPDDTFHFDFLWSKKNKYTGISFIELHQHMICENLINNSWKKYFLYVSNAICSP